jgi:Undecaprenyl-phosphate galactose phosphotransferase WbaP
VSVLLVEKSTKPGIEPHSSQPRRRAVESVRVNRPARTFFTLLVADVAAISAALFVGSALRHWLAHHAGAPIAGTVLPALLINLAIFTVAGLYPGVCINPVEELRRCFLSVTLSFLSLWSATFFLHDLSQSRLVYALAFLLANIFVPLLRVCARRLFCRSPWWGSQVAILGYGETGKLLMRTLSDNPQIGLRPIAVFDDSPANYKDLDPNVLHGPLSRCLQITRDHRVSYGIVCMPSLSREKLLELIDVYGQCFSHLLVIPNLVGMTSLGISAREMGGIVGLEIKLQLLRPSARLAKRALDLCITVTLAPFIALIIAIFAILIKLEDGGPVFYENERIGKEGVKFKLWKLRSMKVDADALLHEYLAAHPDQAARWALTQKLPNDPRITRVGRIIRKTSVDELPQFWNILIGQMSVVGPRPILENQIAMYGSSFELYKQVRPGVTGLWQVSGRNELSFSDRARLDKYVIQNWSVWLDLYILARTAGVVLTARGAY